MFQTGDLAKAEVLCQAILAASPDSVDAHYLLSRVATERGQLAAGAAYAYSAIRSAPERPELHLQLGTALLRSGDLAGAVDPFRTAAWLAEAAGARQTWHLATANLGLALHRLGKHAEAEGPLQEALRATPESEPLLTTLVGVLMGQGKVDAAMEVARRAVAAGPGQPLAWNNLGVALHTQGQLSSAEQAYQQALSLSPDLPQVIFNRGKLRHDQWRNPEALADFQRAIELEPGYSVAWHALLHYALYDATQTEETIYRAHLRWGQQICATLAAATGAGRVRDWRSPRIRVGYVSRDFRVHSCAHFLRPVFSMHDRQEFEVFAYSMVERPDTMTLWFNDHATQWRDIHALDTSAAAECIREDRIDILVDLGGHTRNSAIELFALQPAPVQVAWLGYPATSGLKQMGYRLTDDHADPPGKADGFHTEELIRLPGGFLCYHASDDTPDVAPLPVTRKGFLTFASFNNPAKITRETITIWAQILREVPRSRLLLRGGILMHDEVRKAMMAAFIKEGVEGSQILLEPEIPREHYSLAVYDEVDIALDTFPYNGTTTTFDALWMGVPVVSLRGHRHAARVGASILTHLGRPEWIADDAREYIEVAKRLASDRSALADCRATLRSTLATSSLCDATGFVAKLERAYLDMLRRTSG